MRCVWTTRIIMNANETVTLKWTYYVHDRDIISGILWALQTWPVGIDSTHLCIYRYAEFVKFQPSSRNRQFFWPFHIIFKQRLCRILETAVFLPFHWNRQILFADFTNKTNLFPSITPSSVTRYSITLYLNTHRF